MGNKAKDFVTAVDEKNVIVVKELEEQDGPAELEKTAQNFYEILKNDGEEDILIAYGRSSMISRRCPNLIRKQSLPWM